jgi:hypothetical protein
LGRELFVYWRLQAGSPDQAVAAVREFQAALRQRHPGLQTGLYRRADDAAGAPTLMETYRMGGGLPGGLQAEIADAGRRALAAWCAGARHVEVFEAWPD